MRPKSFLMRKYTPVITHLSILYNKFLTQIAKQRPFTIPWGKKDAKMTNQIMEKKINNCVSHKQKRNPKIGKHR